MRIALLFSFVLLFSFASSAQVSHDVMAMNNVKKTTKKKTAKPKVVFADTVPDSIRTRVAKVSEKLARLSAANIRYVSGSDTSYKTRTWSSYRSPVIGAPTQVLIDVACSLTHGKGKALKPRYTVTYQADINIYKLTYDNYTRKTKIIYNESHWPGYMYNDKTPSKADLNRDICLAMDHILKAEIKFETPAQP